MILLHFYEVWGKLHPVPAVSTASEALTGYHDCTDVRMASDKLSHLLTCCSTVQWRFGAVGSDVGQINEVTLCRAWLVL